MWGKACTEEGNARDRAPCQGTRNTSLMAGKTQDQDLTCEGKGELTSSTGASHHGLSRLSLVEPELHCSELWYARTRASSLALSASAHTLTPATGYHSRDTHRREQPKSAHPGLAMHFITPASCKLHAVAANYSRSISEGPRLMLFFSHHHFTKRCI